MGVFLENLLLAQLCEALPQGMHVPSELEVLYEWIEANNFYDDTYWCRRAIYIRRISYDRAGVMVSARAAWKSSFSRMS